MSTVQLNEGTTPVQVRPLSVISILLLPIFRMAGLITKRVKFRGIGTLSRQLGRILPAAPIEIRLGNASVLEIDLLDYYWSRMIFRDFSYEPEIYSFMKAYMEFDFAFLDCGANIGYWSILSSEGLAPNRVIAVEASPTTFRQLEKNHLRNGRRFAILHKALSKTSGESVEFFTGTGHAAAHIVAREEGSAPSQTVTVETTTIDEIVSQSQFSDTDLPIVIKLDVEGAEIDALKGASKTLAQRKFVIVYECHGADRDCLTSQYLMNSAGMRIYSMEGDVRRINSVAEIRALKTNLRKGYNFVAVGATFDPIVDLGE